MSLAAARPGIRKNGVPPPPPYAGPVYATSTGQNNPGSSLPWNIAIPAGATVGDFMILALTSYAGLSPTTPQGWAYYSESKISDAARVIQTVLFYRWCQPGDAGTNVSISYGGSNYTAGVIACYSGVDETYPLATSCFKATNGTSFAGPVCNLPNATDTLLVHADGLEVTSGSDPGAITWGSGVTSRRIDNYGPSNYMGFALGEENVAAAGLTTSRLLNVVNSSDFAGYSLGLNKSGVTPSSSAYDTAVLADSPLAYYKLGESTGTQMTDSSGNARHGTYPSLPGRGPGLLNATGRDAALFTASGTNHGTVAYASWMDQASLDVEFWMQDTNGGAALGAILGRLDPGDGVFCWSIRTRSGGNFAVDYYSAAGGIGGPSGGGPSAVGGPVIPLDGDILHVVISHVGTAFNTYVNGALVESTTGPSGYWSGASGHGGFRVYDGVARKVSHVALYPGGTLTAARVQAHYAAAQASATFKEGYNRSDREIVGDNGWYTTSTAPNTGYLAIRSNRLRCLTGMPGDGPGSSGTVGSLICHDVKHANGNIAILEFDLITAGVTTLNGAYLWLIMAGTVNTGGPPPTLNGGVMAKMFIDTTANQLQLAKVTSTNARTAHNPGSFPAFAANATVRMKFVLNRANGQLFVYKDGTLQHTSTAGDFSGLQGSIIGFQFQSAYSSCPYEIDNVLAV